MEVVLTPKEYEKPTELNFIRWTNESPLRTGDIHCVTTDTRLLVRDIERQMLKFQDANLSGEAVLGKSMQTLINWMQAEEGKPTTTEIERPLAAFYAKLLKEGKEPMATSLFLYRAVLLRLLRQHFNHQPHQVLSLFTHWILSYPKVENILDSGKERPAVERNQKIQEIPQFHDSALRPTLVKILGKLNEFSWKSVSTTDENYTPVSHCSLPLEFMKTTFRELSINRSIA
jgi:hypothetical protein